MEDYVYTITTKVTEDYDNFVFETIRPFCEEVQQQVIDKKTLSSALINYKGISLVRNQKYSCGRCGFTFPDYVPNFCPKCGIKVNK